MMFIKTRYTVLALFLLISLHIAAQTPAEIIPDFTFFKMDKSSFTNKNLEPGKMLFFVFFDSDCEHCQRAVLNINQHYSEFKKAAIYLITLDDQGKIKGFMNKYAQNLNGKKNVTLLQDLQNEFIRKFRPRKYPSMFLYSTQKKLIDYEDNEESIFRFLKHINTHVE